MKIKIDTEEKTIQVEGKANFKELNAFFNKAFTEEELKEYTLIQTETINYINWEFPAENPQQNDFYPNSNEFYVTSEFEFDHLCRPYLVTY